jgi:hypothetical protein
VLTGGSSCRRRLGSRDASGSRETRSETQTKPSGCSLAPLFTLFLMAARISMPSGTRGISGAANSTARGAECWWGAAGAGEGDGQRPMLRRGCHRRAERGGGGGFGLAPCCSYHHQSTCVSRRSDRVASPRGEVSQPLSVAPSSFSLQVFFYVQECIFRSLY